MDYFKMDKSEWHNFHDKLHDILHFILTARSTCMLTLESRVKSIQSIRSKLRVLNSNDISKILDIVGFRIVVPKNENLIEIYKLLQTEFDLNQFMKFDETKYEAIHFHISLNKARLDLPEYKRYESYKAEIQIITSL